MASSAVATSNLARDGLQMADGFGNDEHSSASEDESSASIADPGKKEQKRRQHAVFDAWRRRKALKTKDTGNSFEARFHDVSEEKLSLRGLMAKQESHAIVASPRDYQVELFERAKKENIIAVLDTGSGKTLIAVLLLKHILDLELESRSKSNANRNAFFIVGQTTLVFQQCAVLECNLDQPIEPLCGAMQPDDWKLPQWTELLSKAMVVVCTADCLLNGLKHGFVKMDRVNLLIFDEAHHTKKNHGYARIMKEFYFDVPVQSRPRVFGMTASPVDAKREVDDAARELEVLLDATIATTHDTSLMRSVVSRPDEIILEYPGVSEDYATALCHKLEEHFWECNTLEKHIRHARNAARELGDWSGDRVWVRALVEETETNLEQQVRQEFSDGKFTQHEFERELGLLQQARELLLTMQEQNALPPLTAISPKVTLLLQHLQWVYEKEPNTRCIVFVQRRFTARVLQDLFEALQVPLLRTGVLVGAGSNVIGDLRLSMRDQTLLLAKFRRGDVNILFATSVAEEGLDIPLCNQVIRFDPCDTLVRYIQCRGRARHKQSKFVHMVEKDNFSHLQSLRDLQMTETEMRKFCQALPANRKLQGNDYDLDDALLHDKSLKVHVEPSTGAKLTFGSALEQLGNFVDCIPREEDDIEHATYFLSPDGRNFVCEVVLPPRAPLHHVLGESFPRKALAKRSAAFEACLKLRAKGYLDEHLLPTYQKKLPEMRNARLAVGMKHKQSYGMRLKPQMWSEDLGTIPKSLYVHILQLSASSASGLPQSALALLTRRPLPSFPDFPIYPRSRQPCQVHCQFVNTLEVDEVGLALLTSFTLRIYKDLFNKTFENNPSQMSYWLAPFESDEASQALDARALQCAHENDRIEWSDSVPPLEYVGRFIVDPGNGGIRYFTQSVAPDLTALSPVPPDCAKHQHHDSIISYTSSLWKRARERVQWDTNQNVYGAYQMPFRRNWLDDWSDSERSTKTQAYICLQPLYISSVCIILERLEGYSLQEQIAADVAMMGYYFPAILTRLESYMIALENSQRLGLDMDVSSALEAITKDSDNTEEHRGEQIHLQRGMGRNYERLEFIGDTFLKMATSVSLSALDTAGDEFECHVSRMVMLCNRNLYNNAIKLGIPEYIRSQGFNRRTWYPQTLKLLGGKDFKKKVEQGWTQNLRDKTIADVCEALIGAALVSGRENDTMDGAVKAVTIFVNCPEHIAQSWADYRRQYSTPSWMTASPTAATAAQLNLVQQIEAQTGYRFQRPRLLRSAFLHPSYPLSWEGIPCYQKLEFLGDALLDMACVNFMYYDHPDRDPQWLTEHKMAMVSNKFLGAVCVRLGFYKHLRGNTSMLLSQVHEYTVELENARIESNGAKDYWTQTKDPPKCLADIVEAYIGALFLDSDFSFDAVTSFFNQHLRWFFTDMRIYDTFANHHPTTFLANLLIDTYKCDAFRIFADVLPTAAAEAVGGTTAPMLVAAVLVHDTIVGESEGTSSRYAKVRASARALEAIKGWDVTEFRKAVHCTCTNVRAGSLGDAASRSATNANKLNQEKVFAELTSRENIGGLDSDQPPTETMHTLSSTGQIPAEDADAMDLDIISGLERLQIDDRFGTAI